MLKAIIVDDEQNSRENLTFLLKEHCSGIEIIGTAGSVYIQVRKSWNRLEKVGKSSEVAVSFLLSFILAIRTLPPFLLSLEGGTQLTT